MVHWRRRRGRAGRVAPEAAPGLPEERRVVEQGLRRRRPGELLLAQHAVAVDVQVREQVVDEVVPGGLQRPAVDSRCASGSAPAGTRRRRRNPGRPAQPPPPSLRPRRGGVGAGVGGGCRKEAADRQQRGGNGEEAFHASTSLIGLAVGSTMRMGRPTLECSASSGRCPGPGRRWPGSRATLTGRSVDCHAVGAGLADRPGRP